MAMQNFEDDDLDGVVPTPKPTAAAAAPATAKSEPAPAVAAAAIPPVSPAGTTVASPADDFDDDAPKASAGKAVADEDNLDTDFDDEKVYARPGTLTRIRPDKGKAVRIAFLKMVKMKAAKNHFVELGSGKDTKKGTYRCLVQMGSDEQGWCCLKQGKDSEVHVAALVLVYKNADPVTGKYTPTVDAQGTKVAPPIVWELGFVDLSGFNMKQLKKLPDEDQQVYDIDIAMTHAEGRAFGYEFNRVSNRARWAANPELVKEVETACERFKDGKILISKLGKKLNLIEWKALLSGMTVGAEEAKLDNIDDL